jgi:hypothetical protein
MKSIELTYALMWVLSIAYIVVSAKTEAVLFNNHIILARKEDNKPYKDEHYWFIIQRTVVFLIAFVAFSIPVYLITAAVYGLIFPFIHDGFYYYFRNKLNPEVYPLGFIDHSETTDAKISFRFIERLILFVCGVSILVIGLHYFGLSY